MLCVGMLMIVLDGTVVNVALPTIKDDLGFTQSSLAWVVNAYLIAFGGLLLLAGVALTGGYHLAFAIAALLMLVAILIGVFVLAPDRAAARAARRDCAGAEPACEPAT